MNLITTPAQVGYTPAATAIVHSTTASLTSRAPVQPVHLMQYDQAMPVIAVALTANGRPYTVPSGAAVNVRMDKPDGTHVYDPALGVSTDGQTAYIGITAQMTAAAGSSGPIVEIVVNEGVAGTAAFPVIIDPNPVADSAYESTDEYLTLYEILQQAQDAAQIVQQNAQNLQNVTDNLEAIQNAAANAQAAAQSAQEAQQAAQQALGFRTFFSAVSPDENGDLDPSRLMTTPMAQASWTIKSKGDRIQSVQVNGLVQDGYTAGMQMVSVLLDGSSDERWTNYTTTVGVFYCDIPIDPVFTAQSIFASNRAYTTGAVEKLTVNQFLAQHPTGALRFIIRINNTTTSVQDCRDALQSRPITVWFVPLDRSQATGLYIPIQAQGHEYRCEMLVLAEKLDAGDKVESNVSSGRDKEIILTGTEPFSLAASPSNVFQNYNILVNSENFTAICNDYTTGGNSWAGMPDKSILNSSNILGFRDTDFASVEDFKAMLAARYAAGNPVVVRFRTAAYTEANDIPVALETHANGHTYAHDPVTLVAVPYTKEDAAAAQQLASTPSTLPYFDSADVPMLLDDTGEADATDTTEAVPTGEPAVHPMSLAASLAPTPPVAGTYVVFSQDGTTVLVSLKAMQNGGDAATLEGMTLDDIKALISSMIADANK